MTTKMSRTGKCQGLGIDFDWGSMAPVSAECFELLNLNDRSERLHLVLACKYVRLNLVQEGLDMDWGFSQETLYFQIRFNFLSFEESF